MGLEQGADSVSAALRTTKSPAAPSRSLSTCYVIASKVYDAYGHTEFGAPEICGEASLSATGGPGKSLVSDLKQYGLVEKKSAGRFAISQDVKDMTAMTPGSTEFQAAAYEFAKKPKVFQSVLSDTKGKLPEETALANNLRSTYQFNQDKAKTTARAISKSLDWCGVLDNKRNIIQPRPSASAAQDVENQVAPNTSFTEDDADGAGVAGKMLSLDIPLSDGRTAHVKYPHDLTAAEAEKIGKVLMAVSD